MEKHHIGFDIWLPNPSMTRCSARKLLPTPGNVLFTLLVVGGLLFAGRAGALSLRAPVLAGDSTTTISYQGRLADSSGNPVTTSGVGMQFRLYNTDTGGSPLWEETHTAVPVEDGLFHVLMGNTNLIPVSLLASNSAFWLGITVGSDSEMVPREQIASVPYAMIASTVPDGSITTAKIADGAVTDQKLANPNSNVVTVNLTSWILDGSTTTGIGNALLDLSPYVSDKAKAAFVQIGYYSTSNGNTSMNVWADGLPAPPIGTVGGEGSEWRPYAVHAFCGYTNRYNMASGWVALNGNKQVRYNAFGGAGVSYYRLTVLAYAE